MEKKAWIDVKSPRFFIWKAIQYTLLIVSGVKPVIPAMYPKDQQFITTTGFDRTIQYIV
jgi:hypothetical protein